MVDWQLRLKMFTMIMRALMILLYHVVGSRNHMVRSLENDYKRFVARPVVVEDDEG